ncbi:MAG: hypothetical protein RSD29_04205 [Bacilli bacterium]
MKKLVVTIIILLLLFTTFSYFFFMPHNYKLNYELEDTKINEKYDKEKKEYLITLNYKDITFTYKTNDKYTNKRKLISNVEVSTKDNTICINPKSDKLTVYQKCINNNKYISSSLVYKNINEENIKETYKDISIYDLNNLTFLIWNYKDFLYINNKEKKVIDLFDKDIYRLNLTKQIKDYLLVANNDEEYRFNKMYLINTKKGNVKELKLKQEIYFDSYYLGNYKNSVYLVDKKNKQEYEINVKKAKVFKTKSKVLEDNKWKNFSITKLINNSYSWNEPSLVNYYIKDNLLYSSIDSLEETLLTDKKISRIVKESNNDVYYISNDTLYVYNPLKGEKKLLTYREWTFNNENMVFIFD